MIAERSRAEEQRLREGASERGYAVIGPYVAVSPWSCGLARVRFQEKSDQERMR